MGGGLALVSIEMRDKDRNSSLSRIEDDSAIGGWVGVGSYVEISEHFQIGFDVRYSEAEVNLFDKDRKIGGVQSALMAGYHW